MGTKKHTEDISQTGRIRGRSKEKTNKIVEPRVKKKKGICIQGNVKDEKKN